MREIQHRIYDICHFAVSYKKVSRGRKKAIVTIDGSSKEMLAMFPRLAVEIVKTNYDTIVDLVIDNENRFVIYSFV